MTKKLTTEEELILVNRNTGEEYELDILLDDRTSKWEKVFATQMANMLNIVGDEKTRVLAYLIKNKDGLNVIYATREEIAEGAGVSEKTVGRVMKLMRERNFIKKVRNSKWRFSPHIMRHGKASIGAAVIRMYDEVD